MRWESSGSIMSPARQPPELMHYGIPKMKWHVRRFQNYDGSYTEEGRRRYNIGQSREKSGNIVRKNENGKREVWKQSDAEDLSDEELNRRNSRLQREQQYKNSVTSDSERSRQQFWNNVRQDAVKKILIGGAVTALALVMKHNYQKAFDFIGGKGKHLIKNLMQPAQTKKAIRNAVQNYSLNGPKARPVLSAKQADWVRRLAARKG